MNILEMCICCGVWNNLNFRRTQKDAQRKRGLLFLDVPVVVSCFCVFCGFVVAVVALIAIVSAVAVAVTVAVVAVVVAVDAVAVAVVAVDVSHCSPLAVQSGDERINNCCR